MFNKIPQIFRTFSRYERYIFLTAFLAFFISFVFVLIRLIDQNTIIAPASGGEYKEGVVGQPTFVNPVLVSNNDADRDLTEIIFDNLFDLAENYKMDKKGAIWNVRLRENIFWHNAEKITSDDVIFTVKIIQDSDTRSPLFPNWQGVVVERVSEREIKFILPAPYAFFEGMLRELRPIPKEIFNNIPPANLKLSNYNLEPIGSGPFKFDSLQRRRDGFITDFELVRNENYFSQKPYLEQMIFKFYPNYDELAEAFNLGAIDGFGGASQNDLTDIKISYQVFKLAMPRYYAVFFNTNSQPLLKDDTLRLALEMAVDRRSLIERVFSNNAMIVSGPLTSLISEDNFNPEEANRLLDSAHWQINNEGIREQKFIKAKKEEVHLLIFELVVPEIPFLVETANLLKESWQKIGVKLNLTILAASDINNEIIKTRNYEMLLFGNIFGRNPDLFSFWHSSERFYPGLNLSLYNSESADTLIESIRRNLDEESRKADLVKLQSLIIKDRPAIFLFSPFYLYVSKKQIGGFEERIVPLPSGRFEDVENWYLKTERRFK